MICENRLPVTTHCSSTTVFPTRRFLPALLPGLLLCWLAVVPGIVAAEAAEREVKLGRGVNIIGYDPLWRARDQARFQEKHFRLLKEAGFNHVRVNLHPFRHMDGDKNWELPGTGSRRWTGCWRMPGRRG